jgi:hypothetical protein
MPTTAEGEISRARFAAVPLILILLGFAAHLAFLSALATGALNGAFNDATHRFGPGCDFFSIYAAGGKARLGESVFTIGGDVNQVPYAYAFRYAPVVAYILGLALSWLPALTAYGVWLCLCELALLRNIRLTWELVNRQDAKNAKRNEQAGDPQWDVEVAGGNCRSIPDGTGPAAASQTIRNLLSLRSWRLGGSIREVLSHPYSLAAL